LSGVRRSKILKLQQGHIAAVMPSLPVSPGVSRFGTLPPGERTKSPGIHVGPIVLSVINSENPKKYKRYKQIVLKSSKCINCTEVKRHSANHVVLTLTPEVNIVGISKVFSRIF
jgi:hypothetical protein